MNRKVFLFYTAILFIIGTNATAQIHDHSYCRESKIKARKKMKDFDGKKYSARASFGYDLKYYMIFFELDPEVRAIKGSVKSHFIIKSDNFRQSLIVIYLYLRMEAMRNPEVFYCSSWAADVPVCPSASRLPGSRESGISIISLAFIFHFT